MTTTTKTQEKPATAKKRIPLGNFKKAHEIINEKTEPDHPEQTESRTIAQICNWTVRKANQLPEFKFIELSRMEQFNLFKNMVNDYIRYKRMSQFFGRPFTKRKNGIEYPVTVYHKLAERKAQVIHSMTIGNKLNYSYYLTLKNHLRLELASLKIDLDYSEYN